MLNHLCSHTYCCIVLFETHHPHQNETKSRSVCAVPDCKDKPNFGPILMSNDLTFKEAYLCVDCKELLVRELIERVIAQNVPFEMPNN